MKDVPIEQVDRGWPRPERVVLVTSVDSDGRANIIAVGWKMRANLQPPVFAIGLGKKSWSGASILASGEFVLAVPRAELAREVMYCGTHSGREVDKFRETGLTPVPGRVVKAPLIEECLANLECKVTAVQDMGDHRVFFGEVVTCWVSETPGESLLVIGEGEGYEVMYEEGRFRLGRVKG